MADRLLPGQQLNVNQRITSANGRVYLIMQDDGNLVLYRADNNQPLWASNTQNKPVTYAIMQGDGNFVAYDGAAKVYWSTGTYNNPGAWVIAQDDGNLVVYSSSNSPLWASNTVQNWALKIIPPTTAKVGPWFYVQSSVEFDPSSNTAVCDMSLTNTSHALGFTAASKILFYGADGKLLGTAAQDLGVGFNIFGASHAHNSWSTQAPAGTQGFALAQYWDPHQRWPNIDLSGLGQAIDGFFTDVGTFLADGFNGAGEWCNQNPDSCNQLMFFMFVIGATALCAALPPCEVVLTVVAAPAS